MKIQHNPNIFEKIKNNYGISFSQNPLELEVQQQILKHIEGALIGPIIVRLGMTGMFHKYFMEIIRWCIYILHPPSYEKDITPNHPGHAANCRGILCCLIYTC